VPVAPVPPADAQVFLGRLTHLDPDAVVRLRPAAPDRTALWARLPWRALVTREVAMAVPSDVTVGAAALLAGDPVSPRDPDWRWQLPPSPGDVLEEIPAQRLREVAAAAAGTLREVTETGLDGRAVGVRVLREALLDHVAIVVETDAGRFDVPQRLIQAVARMGFLGSAESLVRVLRADPGGGGARRSRAGGGRWVGLAAQYGTAWLPPPPGPLTVRPA
jgi:hypothetical protein